MNIVSGPSVARLDPRREELRALLRECDIGSDGPLADETPLISSGSLDSLALFRVALWVEEQIGHPVHPSTFDLAEEWDSIELIITFIDSANSRQNGGASRRRTVEPLTQSSNVRIIEYTPDYKRAVAELQVQLWGTDLQRNLRYLEWKYERNPCPMPSHIYLALDGDDVVGMRGFHPSRWESRHFACHDFLVADDLVVRADHRNKGVTHHLMREALRSLAQHGIDYVFNFSGSPVTVISSLASSWRSIGAVEPIQHRSRIATLLDEMESAPFVWRFAWSARSLFRGQADPFHRVDALLDTTLTARGRRLRVSRQPQPEKMAHLVRNTGHDGRIRLMREPAYLRWRYQNPQHDYRFFYLEEDGRLDGYLAVKRSAGPKNNPTVHIVDLEANDDESRLALLEAAAGRSLFDVLVVWSTTLPEPCRALLASKRFAAHATSSAVQGHPCMLVRSTDDARLADDWSLHGMRLTEMTNWDMRMLYSMAG